MPVDPPRAVALLLLGVVIGAYGTLVGAGGGFLLVPVLLLGFGFGAPEAAGTSLTVVFLNALSGTLGYWRQHRIDYWSGLRFAAATVPGSVAGAYLSTFFTTRLFSLVFGILLLLLAAFLVVRPLRRTSARLRGQASPGYTHRTLVDTWGERFEWSYDLPRALLLSFGVGFLSSILGIGGGIIHVPAMVLLFAFPAHVATATSHFVLAISALVGAASHLWLGHVRLLEAAELGIGVSVGAQIGARLARRVHDLWLVRALAVALVLVGLRLILGV